VASVVALHRLPEARPLTRRSPTLSADRPSRHSVGAKDKSWRRTIPKSRRITSIKSCRCRPRPPGSGAG